MRNVMVLVGLVAIGCSTACADSGSGGSAQGGENGSGGDDGNGGDNGNGGSLNVGGTPSDGGNPNPTGAGGTPDPGSDCTDEADFQACAQCFAGEDPAGAQAYQGTLLGECACTNPAGDCYAACSADPACSGQQPGAECNSCITTLSNNSACVADFSTACMADPACSAFGSALAGCPQ